jgi:hypothetical protein
LTVNTGAFSPGVVAKTSIPTTKAGKIIEMIILAIGHREFIFAKSDAKGLNPVNIEIR